MFLDLQKQRLTKSQMQISTNNGSQHNYVLQLSLWIAWSCLLLLQVMRPNSKPIQSCTVCRFMTALSANFQLVKHCDLMTCYKVLLFSSRLLPPGPVSTGWKGGDTPFSENQCVTDILVVNPRRLHFLNLLKEYRASKEGDYINSSKQCWGLRLRFLTW